MNEKSTTSPKKKKYGELLHFCTNQWERRPATILFVFAFLTGFGFIWINPVPADDTMIRYAIMAESFANGEWELAFHPRYGVLFSVISGIFRICIPWGNSFRACQIAALLLWSLSVFPLFAIFRTIFDRKLAITGNILYLLCSHLHRYVYDGLRDNGKTLGFALLLYGLLQFYHNRKSESAWINAGLGAAVLSMLRVDGFAFSCCMLFVFWIFDLQSNKLRFRRTVFAVLFLFTLLSPQILLTYQWTGIPVPNSAYAFFIRDKLHLFVHQQPQKNAIISEGSSND